MINRVLLRIKIVQILYSYFKNEGKSLPLAEKELFHSIEKTYDLYFHLLQLSIEITRYAAEKIETKRNRHLPTFDDLNPNTRFIDNAFIAQLSENIQFNEYLTANKLSWVNDLEIIKVIFEEIVASEFYAEYMATPETGYAADKDIWRKIFKKIILQSEALDDSIQDQNIYWTDDIEMVVSFIIKTIKRFDLSNGNEQPLPHLHLVPNQLFEPLKPKKPKNKLSILKCSFSLISIMNYFVKVQKKEILKLSNTIVISKVP